MMKLKIIWSLQIHSEIVHYKEVLYHLNLIEAKQNLLPQYMGIKFKNTNEVEEFPVQVPKKTQFINLEEDEEQCTTNANQT